MENQPDNSIVALRAKLFETLRSLSDPTKPMEIERAKAISDVAQTIINSAKVEVEHLRVTGGSGSGFIPVTHEKPKGALDILKDKGIVKEPLRPGINHTAPGVLVHKMGG
jgi:hypothetical protein